MLARLLRRARAQSALHPHFLTLRTGMPKTRPLTTILHPTTSLFRPGPTRLSSSPFPLANRPRSLTFTASRGSSLLPVRLGAGGFRRDISFSAAPRFVAHFLRLPVALAGVGAGTVSYASYKYNEFNDKVKEMTPEWMRGGLYKFRGALDDMEKSVEDADIGSYFDSFSSTISSGLHSLGDNFTRLSTPRHPSEKGKPSGEPDQDVASAAVTAAAIAAVIREEETEDEEEEEEEEEDLSAEQSGIPPGQGIKPSGQFMMLTKKLIEIRNILKTIEGNDALRLPSIVVIGSQSSGKSSVLEAIVGHEFLPKGSNMVTRRPIELTLVNSPPGSEEYGEFPQLGLGRIRDFRQVQSTLKDLNMAVSDEECVSDKPIELRIHSPNVPDLTLVDLPGYIQVTTRNQPPSLKARIADLCEIYIQEPNIILTVCSADVDLANSEALMAARRVDPLGLRTIGVISKADLVPPEHVVSILENRDYPLLLGYVGVVCKAGPATSSGRIGGILGRAKGSQMTDGDALIQRARDREAEYFSVNHAFNRKDLAVGTDTLRRKLTEVLEDYMGRNLHGIVDAVQGELDEARYQYKVQYNDRRLSPESYVADTVDGVKQAFKELTRQLDKPRVRAEVRALLEQRAMDICAQYYWSDPAVGELSGLGKVAPKEAAAAEAEKEKGRRLQKRKAAGSGKSSPSKDEGNAVSPTEWSHRLDVATAHLTKSGVGRAVTQHVVDVLTAHLHHITGDGLLSVHPETQGRVLGMATDILRAKYGVTVNQVENTIKPYKYDIECSDAEWQEGLKRATKLVEREIAMCESAQQAIKASVGKRRLRAGIEHILSLNKDAEKERTRREREGGLVAPLTPPHSPSDPAPSSPFAPLDSQASSPSQEHTDTEEVDESTLVSTQYSPILLERARESMALRQRALVLKYRLAALKSRACKTLEGKVACPEAFLAVVTEKLTYTSVMFLQVELLNEFFFQFPREVDDRLYYDLDKAAIQAFARENPDIRKQLDLLDRRSKLEAVMEKLDYLSRGRDERRQRR